MLTFVNIEYFGRDKEASITEEELVNTKHCS